MRRAKPAESFQWRQGCECFSLFEMRVSKFQCNSQSSQVDDAAAESMELQRVRTGRMAKKGPHDGCNCNRSYAVQICLAHKCTKHSDWVGFYHDLQYMHLPKKHDREENNTVFDPFWLLILVDSPGTAAWRRQKLTCFFPHDPILQWRTTLMVQKSG